MRTALVLVALLGLSSASCSDATRSATLRFSVLPDWNKGQLTDNATLLSQVLAERLGVPVRYVPSNDYTACVNALAANTIDFVWLGGKTTVDAIDGGEGHVRVLATRDIDLQFRSYFIGNRDSVANGRIGPVEQLAAWRGEVSDVRFTFGSLNSTSGHLMPRWFLSQAGVVPEQEFRTVGFQEVGSHAATLEAVASGAFDCGALNYAYYDQAPAETKAKAPVLFTTPEYVDYAWVVHDRIGAATVEKLREALLSLDRSDERDAKVLDAWAAGAFVAARDEQWQPIRAVRDSLGTGFLGRDAGGK